MKHWRLFIESTTFTKYIGNYLTDDQYKDLQEYLLEHPKAGDIIPKSGGVRKVRWGLGNKGKSGGIRVIYYLPSGNIIWFLTVYAKGEVSTIPGPTLKKIKEAMKNE